MKIFLFEKKVRERTSLLTSLKSTHRRKEESMQT